MDDIIKFIKREGLCKNCLTDHFVNDQPYDAICPAKITINDFFLIKLDGCQNKIQIRPPSENYKCHACKWDDEYDSDNKDADLGHCMFYPECTLIRLNSFISYDKYKIK